jgi:hypothetical protein
MRCGVLGKTLGRSCFCQRFHVDTKMPCLVNVHKIPTWVGALATGGMAAPYACKRQSCSQFSHVQHTMSARNGPRHSPEAPCRQDGLSRCQIGAGLYNSEIHPPRRAPELPQEPSMVESSGTLLPGPQGGRPARRPVWLAGFAAVVLVTLAAVSFNRGQSVVGHDNERKCSCQPLAILIPYGCLHASA